MSDRFDCAICGARGVKMSAHLHVAEYGRVYDQPRRSRYAYSMQFIGWAPLDAVMTLFSRFGILSEGEPS